MNIAFSKVLKIGEGKREFNFRKLPLEIVTYHVDVTDEKGARILFVMYKNAQGNWQSEGVQLPLWIVAAEHILGEAIEEEQVFLKLK